MDGIQVSNCITELTGPTIALGLVTPLAGGGMLQELCAAAAVMVGLSLAISRNLNAGGISIELLTAVVDCPVFRVVV